MTFNFATQVASGMALLDEQQPGWREKIDLDHLDLGSCSVCVLGQIFGDYEEGTIELGIEDDPYKYGFNSLTGGMASLTQAWKDALGKSNVLVEVNDVYSDTPGCCMVKVVGTEMVNTGSETITLYIVQHGHPDNGAFKGSTPAKDNLSVLLKKDFEKETGSYFKKVENFVFKKGQFLTNDTGKVYYVTNPLVAREVADDKWAVNTSDIDRKGLREVRLPSGTLFSDTVS